MQPSRISAAATPLLKSKFPHHRKYASFPLRWKLLEKKIYIYSENRRECIRIFWGEKPAVWMLASFTRVEQQLCCYFIACRIIFWIIWLTFMTLATNFRPSEDTICKQYHSVIVNGPSTIMGGQWRSNSRSQWPRGLRRRYAAARLLRLWIQIPPGAKMSVCYECCVLQVEASATSWSLAQRSLTDCGPSLCVIWKPHEWGGHGPRWAAAPRKKWRSSVYCDTEWFQKWGVYTRLPSEILT